MAGTPQSGEMHLPEVPAPPASAVRADAPGAEIIQMRQRMQRWRGFSTITGLMAACLVGIVLVREYKPDVLPPELRPQRPVQVVERIVEKPVEVVREVVREVPAPRPAQLVAVFQKDEQSPEFILTVDVEKRTLTVRTVAAQRQPDRDFQIWIQPRPDVPPESLGLVEHRRVHGAHHARRVRADRHRQRDLRHLARARRRLADRPADRPRDPCETGAGDALSPCCHSGTAR